MASEVYQLQVNNTPITLGKGSNTNDAFISIKEVGLSTICGFAYVTLLISDINIAVRLVLPVTRQFAGIPDLKTLLTKFNLTAAKPWPIFAVLPTSGNSLDIQCIGFPAADQIYVNHAGTVSTHYYKQQDNISFIWFN
jgi:hypothetical protein